MQVLGVQVVEDFPGGGVDVADGAAQPDRAHAPAGRHGRAQPLLVVVPGDAVEQLGVQRPGPAPARERSSIRTGPRAGAGVLMGRALAGFPPAWPGQVNFPVGGFARCNRLTFGCLVL
jgi:hypothetical protein